MADRGLARAVRPDEERLRPERVDAVRPAGDVLLREQVRGDGLDETHGEDSEDQGDGFAGDVPAFRFASASRKSA